MAEKTSDWRPGPTVCRCCLAEGCYKDISTEYFWMGKREVYAEMLSDTLSVSIAYSQSGGPNSNSRLICESCISRLRDATDFKRQVLECEKTFMNLLDPGSSTLVKELQLSMEEVKVEHVKTEKASMSDDDFDDQVDFVVENDDDDDDDLDDEPLMKLASKEPKKEVNITELLKNSQVTVKRKAAVKAKAPPAKKAKKQIVIKPTASKAAAKATASSTPKTEKKKKGRHGQTGIETDENVLNNFKFEETYSVPCDKYSNMEFRKSTYQRSARAEARTATKKNATSILECWTFCPFRCAKNRFKCAYCEANFTECTSLRDHVRICSTEHNIKDVYHKFKEMSLINVDITDAICCFCSTPFVDLAQMRDHVVNHGFEFNPKHPDGVLPFSLDKDCWKCTICQQKFNNFLKLYEHMNVHYQHYICAICGKGYMSAPRLRKHSEVHISGSFPCGVCGKVFVMRAARDAHKANSHRTCPRYECPHCNTRFRSYTDRMTHLRDAHSEKPVVYSCSHCDLSFKTSGSRAHHVRYAHFPPKLQHRCNQCEWHFKTKYELKRHMVKHTGEKNFHCNLCEKSFSRSRALTTHLKSHENLNCKWCGLDFKQKNQLVLHSQTNHVDLMDITGNFT